MFKTERSEEKQSKRTKQNQEWTDMAKKKAAEKKEAARRAKGRKMYEYVGQPKDDISSKKAMTVVLETIQKMKKASVTDVAEKAAAKLKGVSDIDPHRLTSTMLRKLQRRGAVKQLKEKKEDEKKVTVEKKKKAAAPAPVKKSVPKKPAPPKKKAAPAKRKPVVKKKKEEVIVDDEEPVKKDLVEEVNEDDDAGDEISQVPEEDDDE
jgi:hypothetical protein